MLCYVTYMLHMVCYVTSAAYCNISVIYVTYVTFCYVKQMCYVTFVMLQYVKICKICKICFAMLSRLFYICYIMKHMSCNIHFVMLHTLPQYVNLLRNQCTSIGCGSCANNDYTYSCVSSCRMLHVCQSVSHLEIKNYT